MLSKSLSLDRSADDCPSRSDRCFREKYELSSVGCDVPQKNREEKGCIKLLIGVGVGGGTVAFGLCRCCEVGEVPDFSQVAGEVAVVAVEFC